MNWVAHLVVCLVDYLAGYLVELMVHAIALM